MSPAIVTKAQLMQAVIAGHQRECFEHSTEGIFDVTAMRDGLASGTIPGELVYIAMECIAPFVRENRVTEQARIDSLDEASWKLDPAIFIHIVNNGEESHLMIDGHHRALRREKEGFDSMPCWIVEKEHAVRPAPGWVQNPFVDWGDALVDGRIVKR